MVATAIVLLCTLASAPHKAEVTFKEPPARLENVLASLSETAGVRLSCSSALKDRVLFIQVQDVQLEELKDHIAYVLDGKWEEKDQRSLLVVDNETLEARRAKLRGRYVTDVKKGFSDLQKELPEELTEEVAQKAVQEIRDLSGNSGDFDRTRYAELQRQYSIAPAAKLAARLFARLIDERFDELPVYNARRAVFTNLRNSAYNKITVDSRLLKEYDKSQQLWDRIVEQFEATVRPNAIINASMKASSSTRPAKTVFLMAARRSKLSRIEVSIAILDDQGQYKAGSEITFQNPMTQNRSDAGRLAPVEGRKIVLSEDATRYLQAIDHTTRPLVHIQRDDPLYARVIDPVKHDPHSFSMGEVVDQALSRHGNQIVAELIDEMSIIALWAVREPGLTDLSVLERLVAVDEAEIDRHDSGFVTMRSQDPDKHLYNFPRESLKMLAQSFDKLGYVDLKTLVEHGFPSGQFVIQSLSRWIPYSMIRILSPGYTFALATFNQSMPRYANVLTQAERDALLSGRQLLFGRLTTASKRRLNDLLVEGIDVYGQSTPNANFRAPDDLQAILLFPYGLTDDTVLQIEAKTVVAIGALVTPDTEYASDYIIGSEGRGAHGIGVRLATTKEPPKFWLGQYLTGSFVLKQGGEILVKYQVSLPMVDFRGDSLTLKDLSADTQQSLEKSKQAKLKALAAGYTGSIPPPN